jgi:hypothetical protein
MDERTDDRYVSMCLGKHRFDTRSEARSALGNQERVGRIKKRGPRKGKIEVYRCAFCHYWHYGSGRRRQIGPKKSRRVEWL